MNASPRPVALVTGAARRVGAEIARTLHARGARVAIHYRSSAAAAWSLAAELNASRADSADGFAADLLDLDTLPRLVAAVTARFGRLDALVAPVTVGSWEIQLRAIAREMGLPCD